MNGHYKVQIFFKVQAKHYRDSLGTEIYSGYWVSDYVVLDVTIPDKANQISVFRMGALKKCLEHSFELVFN